MTLIPNDPVDALRRLHRDVEALKRHSHWYIPTGDGDGGGTGTEGPQGPAGPQGPKGDPGSGVTIKGELASTGELPATAANGDAYLINGNLYVWTGAQWDNVGNIQGPRGPEGPQGPVGPQGPQGPKGDPGPAGHDGAQGPEGPQGPAGTAVTVGAVVDTVNHLPPTGTFDEVHFVVETGDLYIWHDGQWWDMGHVQGPQGPRGIQGIQGPEGPPGHEGVQGPVGPQGPAGPEGPAGPQGNDGRGITIKGTFTDPTDLPAQAVPGDAYLVNGDLYVFGAAGWQDVGHIEGPQGPVGPRGPQGERGLEGAQGPAGPKGDPGQRGEQGPEGPAGPKGDTGPRGPQGIQGPKGDPGPAGHDGAQGVQGIEGPQGPAGTAVTIGGVVDTVAHLPTTARYDEVHFVVETGDLYVWQNDGVWHDMGHVQGPQGVRGPEGPAGPKGDPGPAGHDGADGLQGPRGVQGPAGPDGRTAYELYVATVPADQTPMSEQEWLDSLQGAPGTDGNDADLDDHDKVLVAVRMVLGDIIGDYLALDPAGERIDALPAILPGIDSVRGNDGSITVDWTDMTCLDGMTVSVSNPSDEFAMKVLLIGEGRVTPAQGGGTVFYMDIVGDNLITDNHTRTIDHTYEYQQLEVQQIAVLPPGATGTWCLAGRVNKSDGLFKFGAISATPLNFEVEGDSHHAAYTYGGNAATTSVNLVADDTSVTSGDAVNFVATVSPDTAVGKIVFEYRRGTSGSWSTAKNVVVAGGTATYVAHPPSNTQYRARFVPDDSSAFKVSTSNTVTVTAASAQTRHSTTRSTTDFQTYEGDGSKRTWGTPKAYWGVSPGNVGGYGNMRSVFIWTNATRNILSSLSGSDIISATIKLSVEHTYANSGGDVAVSFTTATSIPSTLSSLPSKDFTMSGPKTGTWTVDVPSSKFAELANSGGIILHRNGTGQEDYGYAVKATLVLKYMA